MGYAGSPFHQGPGPQWINDPLKPFGPPDTFCNTEQSVTLTCPDGTTGDPITVTKEAGTYCGYATQELANAAALAAAQAEAEALREASPCVSGNTLWGWGYNRFASLGVGNNAKQPAPVLVGWSALQWSSIKSGGSFSLGLKSDKTLWSWGSNFEGELGLGTQSIFPDESENKLYPTLVGGGWESIDCGEQFGAGIKDDGSLWAWGFNFYGQLGQGDTDDRLSPVQIGSGTDWSAVACSTDCLIALKSDGTVWAAGKNTRGELGNGTGVDSSVLVQTGALTSDWASIGVAKSGVGNSAFVVCVKTDGTLWRWGNNWLAGGFSLSPVQVGSDTDWERASGGYFFCIGKKTDGSLWGSGNNNQGQLGLGNLTFQGTFVQIGSDFDWSTFACGEAFSGAIKTSGAMYGWGANNEGELGQGGYSSAESTPLVMGSDSNWAYLTAGFNDSFALRTVTTDPAPPPITNGIASGGIYSEAGGNSIHRFDAFGTFTVFDDTVMDFLIVGGGGGGGGYGGGGAGQVQKFTSVLVPAGTYPIEVADYALRAFGGEDRGSDGGSATFNGEESIGGGGGAAGEAVNDTDATGKDGASGGGGGCLHLDPFTGFPGGNGTAGNDGGGAVDLEGGGGGGGSGGVGGNASNSGSGIGGTGGIGTADSISGASVLYGAGGGGGSIGTAGAGGSSVGGTGASTTVPATNPLTAGSGGGGACKDLQPASDGAFGTVIISYPTPP